MEIRVQIESLEAGVVDRSDRRRNSGGGSDRHADDDQPDSLG
jgi:hypothetical protein